MKTELSTLASALDILAESIQSKDGIANAAIAEAAQRLRDLDWVSTKDRLPANPSHFQRDSLPCICIHLGNPVLLRWNFHYENWDDSEGDDFFCAPLDVELWMPVPNWKSPEPPKPHPPFNG